MKKAVFLLAAASCAVGVRSETIRTAAAFVSRLAENPSGAYRLAADIDLAGTDWKPVGMFTGVLDGGGHALTGLGAAPLFTTNAGCVVSLTLDGRTADGRPTAYKAQYGGCFAVYSVGAYYADCRVSGYDLHANATASAVGLYSAYAYDGTHFVRCTTDASCTVTQDKSRANAHLGGLVGVVKRTDGETELVASFVDCVNAAAIVRLDRDGGVGGLVGVAGYKTLSRLPGRGYWRFENSANYGAIAVDAAGHVGGLCGYGTSNAGYNTGKYLWVNCAGYGEIASPVAAGAIVGEINVGNGVNTLAAFSNCWVSAGALFTNCTTACATDNAFAADDPGLAPESALAQMNAWAAGNAGCLPWVAGEASRPEIALFLPNVQLSDVPVLFYGHDGTLLKEETVQPGGVAVPPRAPVREGWHFSGWSGKSAGVTSASVVFAGYSRIGTAPGLCVLLR